MADDSGRWSSSLRSRLLEAVGVEYALRRRVNAYCFWRSADGRGTLTFFLAPCAEPELLTRLRLLITSVFRLIGRGLPWSFRNRPQALQRTEPISSRRQRGVVEVVQFWQVGCVVSRSLAAIVAMVMDVGELGEFCYREFDCDKRFSVPSQSGNRQVADARHVCNPSDVLIRGDGYG
jgi:hypothetical protein